MSAGRVLLALSGWIALAATALTAGGAVRIVLTVAFLVLGPGAALTGLRRRLTPQVEPDAGEDRILTVVISLCLATLVSEAFYLGHCYTTVRAMSVLAGITTLAALCPGRRARGARGTRGARPAARAGAAE